MKDTKVIAIGKDDLFRALSHYYPEYLNILLKRSQMRNSMHR